MIDKCLFFTRLVIYMKYIKQSVLYILFVWLFLYITSYNLPWLGFSLISEYSQEFVIYFFLALIFWFIHLLFTLLLKILNLIIPKLAFLIFSLIIDFVLLYVFEQFINYLDIGVFVQLGNVIQVFILSLCLSCICFLVKKI